MELLEVGRNDEALLLDLLNTTPAVDGRGHDTLAEPAAARVWLQEHGATEVELAGLIEARDVLQGLVRGEVRGAQTTAVLQPVLDAVAVRAHATQDGVRWELDVADAKRGAARAILAWDALRAGSPGRLRACGNPDCRLFLIDRSKPNTARWCSMATCGNRMKARRYHQRARTAKTEEQS